MVRDGIHYGVGLSVSGFLISIFLSVAWGLPFFLLAAFCLYFFRDPEREIPRGAVAVSPADGKVVSLQPSGDGGHRVSVFLNIFDVHVNRIPVSGRITALEYQPGKFRLANRESASLENEHTSLTIESGSATVVVRQIAGLIARRIVCHKSKGDIVEKGERFGLIKFGSRVDILLGPEWDLLVRRGERVKGGSSILARLRD